MMCFVGVMGLTLITKAGVQAAAATAPAIYAGLRGVAGDAIEPGEPFFVGVRLEAPFESAAAVELSPKSGTWADGVSFVWEGNNEILPARAAFTASTEPLRQLDEEEALTGEWLIGAAATSQLAPGRYQLRVQFTIAGERGWSGTVVSEPLTVNVVAVVNSPERDVQRVMALASEALVTGHLQEAAHRVDGLLAAQPDNERLLLLRAKICARAGDLRGAMICLNRAMTGEEAESATHPSIELFTLSEQVSEAMMTAGWYEKVLPAWSKLPSSVLAPRLTAQTSAVANAQPAAKPEPQPGRAETSSAAPVTPASNRLNGSEPSPTKPGAPTPGVLVAANAVAEADILAEVNGQWASSAIAGSHYAKTSYTAMEATGAPNVPRASDSAKAWCHHGESKGREWLEVTYAKPVHATQVRVRQSLNPGTIVKVEAIEADGTSHVWWEGKDPGLSAPTGTIAWFSVRVPKTDYPVEKIKLTLDLSLRIGWKQIDAVQLVGAP